MKGETAIKIRAFTERHTVAAYFITAYTISWASISLAVAPKFLRGETLQLADAMLMFLSMLAGPSIAGIVMTTVTKGKTGLRELFSRMGRWRVGLRWYAAALLIPPVLITAVLLTLSALVSPDFTPGFNALGIIIGLVAGFFEEIGWTGFALPRLQQKYSALGAALLIGVLWSSWHLLADYLGSSVTLGAFWLPHFFAMMILAMTAMRVLIAWVYNNTKSVLLAQLMHASSTGFLAALGPSPISPANDTLWYTIYALVLWAAVAAVVATHGKELHR